MKKTLILVMLIVFTAAFTLNLSADEGKKMNVFGGLGFALADFEGLFFDIGAEMQITSHIYGQLLFDYYFSPNPDGIEGVNDSAYGINLYAVYKHKSSDTLNIFAKAGVHYTTVKASASGAGYSISVTSSDFGIAGGGGIEYVLNDKLALMFGGTLKLIFAEDTGTWFKIYGGISYRVK